MPFIKSISQIIYREKSIKVEFKKIILFVFTIAFLVSCGTKKSTSHSIGKSDGVQSEIIDYGMKYLNKPYRYAGKGPNSFDCSGFTSFVFREFGFRLSTSSSGQSRQVPSINRKEDLRVGDLVFFEGRSHNGRVGHVGIVKEIFPNRNFTFIHSSTSYGVIVSRSTEPYYASRYLHGGRVLKENNQIIIASKTKKKPEDSLSNVELRKAKKDNVSTKDPIIVKAPKTQTEQELELTTNYNNPDNSIKNDSIIIHTRQLPFTTYAESKSNKEDDDEKVSISKLAIRTNNRGIPKPAKSNGKNTPQQYKVMPGDTLYSISQRYSCDVDQLRKWNPQLNSNLKAGEVLNIYQ